MDANKQNYINAQWQTTSSTIWQQDALTTYPSCSTTAIQKSLALHENYWKIVWKQSQEHVSNVCCCFYAQSTRTV